MDKKILRAGFMNKQGGSFKTWKKRWFTLEDGDVLYLSYYPNEKAEGALGTLDLSQCRAVRPVPTKDTAKAFYFEVDAPDRTYLINTDSTENRDEWIQAIQEGLERMQLKREGGELRDASKVGYLFKQGGKDGNKGWRRRWFVLQGDSMMYYKSENDKKILGRLSLGQCNSIGPADPLQVRRENCFKLGFSGRTYIIGAENGEDRDDWMEKLEECVPETAQRGAPAVNEQDEEGGEEEASSSQPAPGGVQTDALILQQQEADQQPIAKAGFLAKTGGTVKSVKRRWFVLRGNLLSYFQTENDKEPLGTIDLNKCTGLKVVEEERRGVRPNSFELITRKRTYIISADTPEERDEWKAIIEDTIPEEPQADDEEAANFAARAIAATASSVKNAVAASKAKIFGADAPVENDPSAMKKIAAADDDEDNMPVSPNGTQPKSMLDVGSLKAGWMMKQGGSVKTMKRRYFVLRGLALAYYKTDQDTGPQGVIDLTQCTGVDKKPAPPKGQNNWGFDIVTRARTYYVEAESETSRQQWIAVIGSQVDAKNRPDQAALIASKREGYLEKRGGANRAWKRRYFVVLGTRLFYFSDEKRERPLGAIELKECFGVYSVPLARHGRPNVFELVTPDRIYAIVADSEEIRDGWLSLIADMIPASEPVSSLGDSEPGVPKEGQIKAGVLEKKPADPKLPWSKRWVALGADNVLYIQRTDKETTPIQIIDLKLATAVREVPRGTVDRPFALSIQGRGTQVFYLAAPSQSILAEWVSAIREAMPSDEEARANAEAENEPVLMCGYLNKMGGSRKSWRKRWFVFRGKTIRYYKGPKDDEELGSINLDLLADSTCLKGDLKLDVPNGFAMITPDRTYYCGAETEDIRGMWLTAIRKYLDARGPVDPNAVAKGDAEDDD